MGENEEEIFFWRRDQHESDDGIWYDYEKVYTSTKCVIYELFEKKAKKLLENTNYQVKVDHNKIKKFVNEVWEYFSKSNNSEYIEKKKNEIMYKLASFYFDEDFEKFYTNSNDEPGLLNKYIPNNFVIDTKNKIFTNSTRDFLKKTEMETFEKNTISHVYKLNKNNLNVQKIFVEHFKDIKLCVVICVDNLENLKICSQIVNYLPVFVEYKLELN